MVSKIIVVIDGYCNLCSGLAQFLIRIDKQRKLHFVAGQSQEGIDLLQKYNLIAPETIVVIDQEKIIVESEAVLYVLSSLHQPWKSFSTFRFLPKGFRNALYRFIARNRLSFFGRRKSCYVPIEK